MSTRAFSTPLPIDAVLGKLTSTLEETSNAVLVADPGAGKTTRVPLALLDAPWRGDRRILVLEPRRLAARAAAQRMASELGEAVGERVGYRVRMDTRVGPKTRIEVITEGIFTRMILDDPELSGIAAVLFDEFHERSLDGDLGLALALDVQGALREDLRLIPMSATIDAASVSRLMGECEVIESKGRSFPVQTHYLGRRTQDRLEPQIAKAVRKALDDESGSVLVFLPGQAEIKRTADLLAGTLPHNCVLAPLYGALDGRAQDLAIRPAEPGTRKIVLATAIAQTSLTIEGVRVVIDSGLSRVPKYEPQTGLNRLETVRVSLATADQRRGRAGRTEPGVCYRLWDEAQTAALVAHETPEILETDLSALALDLASWGTLEPSQLAFLDPPPAGAWAEALSLLRSLGALNANQQLTSQGKALGRLPLSPRLAHMLNEGQREGAGRTAAYLAVLLSEPGLGGRDPDLREQLRQLRDASSKRAQASRSMAERWLALLNKSEARGKDNGSIDLEDAGWLLALAYPDRIADARGSRGRFRLSNGRGAALPEEHALAVAPFLVVADIQGRAANGRIMTCAPITKSEIEHHFGHDIVEEDRVRLEKDGSISARRILRLGAVELETRQISSPDPAAVEQAMVEELGKRGSARLPWSKDQLRLRSRIGYLRQNGQADLPDLSDESLTRSLKDWLGPFLAGRRSLDDIDAACLGDALSNLLLHDVQAKLDRLAPTHFNAPTGTRAPIDYGAESGPSISIRVQELFGQSVHPSVCGGKIPLTLELLSPAHRPIQVTRDLPGFWAGSWADVKAEMKGRYPKHPWPDDPLNAEATSRVKPRKKT
ncbi:ATP-dependent helicase HrpB [Roseibium polysiphoniae]|uniref:ATP-dependent helicase HrpB n=1 Tax=Roseibium polysiphoniae TaxID=2571221 RepID=A0A944CGL0_9HYPH|nr:ATP-dependent helicase HrpB [Roseibium polysiphoniae]MBS8262468.1 ATP-dependent helicase HrpB [Roseibium polysiphoniae]